MTTKPVEYLGTWFARNETDILVHDAATDTWTTWDPEAKKSPRVPPDLLFEAGTLRGAREAREAGQSFYQVSLPLSTTQRSWDSILFGNVVTKTADQSGQPHVLQLVESEGWSLFHVGYVFRETGSISRDKLFSSGQVEQVTGEIVGVYLFRRNN